MSMFVNDAGNLREITEAYVNDAGTLRKLTSFEVNDNGTLRSIPFEVFEGTLFAESWYQGSGIIGYYNDFSMTGSFSTPNDEKLVDLSEWDSLFSVITFNSGTVKIEWWWSSDPTSSGRPYPIDYLEITGDFGDGEETFRYTFPTNHIPGWYQAGTGYRDSFSISMTGKGLKVGHTYKLRVKLR